MSSGEDKYPSEEPLVKCEDGCDVKKLEKNRNNDTNKIETMKRTKDY